MYKVQFYGENDSLPTYEEAVAWYARKWWNKFRVDFHEFNECAVEDGNNVVYVRTLTSK